MKKFVLFFTMMVGLCAFGFTGCGGTAPTVVVPEAEAGDSGLSPDEMREYEEDMKTGGGN